MSSRFNSDEEVLARLVREAGDPSVAPDPQYAETLRAMLMDRVGPAETVAHATEAIGVENIIPINTVERIRKMKRIAKFAVAATILVAFGILVSWIVIGGGSTNVAFAQVAEVLDSLRSATFDLTSEAKGQEGQPPATASGKGFFLAPSHQRIEVSTIVVGAVKTANNQITIIDGQTAQSISLTPGLKLAVVMDMKKIREDMNKSAYGAPPDLFEMVRRLVREGSSGTGEKVESLGKKEIDGREAVGFRVNANMMDMTLWADPETAWPIRIEVGMDMGGGVRMVMNNFRYNVDLDSSLFSLEPPEGYSIVAMEMTMPVEEDLLRTLRTIAEHCKGVFPAKLGMNKEVMASLMADGMPAMDKVTEEKMNAAMNKVAAKYGGKEKLKEKYGKDNKLPPAIMAEISNAGAAIMQEGMQERMQEQMQKQIPLMHKQTQGITFYGMLKPANDPHYVGGGVKLGTPDCPILWYKPTGADKYHVIYADLSIKELSAEEVKTLSEATSK